MKTEHVSRSISLCVLCAVLLGSVSALAARPIPETGFVRLPDGAVELARTVSQQIRGLMFRKVLPDSGGMLFVYDKPGIHAIWMKNCFLSLDLIWLDRDGVILYIEHNAPPCQVPDDDCPTYAPMQLASYVLEVKGGVAKRHGLKIGDRLVLTVPRGSAPPAS